MDDIAVQYSVRILLGVITLAGILWGAIKYLVNYTVDRSEARSIQRVSQLRAEYKTDINAANATIDTTKYRMDAHFKNEHPKIEARLQALERRSNREKSA